MNKFKNRDYKFRVWDGETMDYCEDSYSFCIFKNKVHEVDYRADYCQVQNFAYETADVNLNPQDCAIMQYTGLKDKYGKDIYEGDILRSHEGIIREVLWYIPDSAWRLKEKNGNVTMSFKGWVYDTTIIGNIYENPELLK